MPRLLSEHDIFFPSYDEADEHGIIAIGGDFNPKRLIHAYELGIFPWPHEGYPLLWFFPSPRFVLRPKELVIGSSLKKAIKKTELTVYADRDFKSVIEACRKISRPGQYSTWISDELMAGYLELHHLGYAHSIEAYRGFRLVGGLYGVSIGSIFFGESMFFYEDNASKIAFVTLAAQLVRWGFMLIDCQMPTKNFEKFGARAINVEHFLEILKMSQNTKTKRGQWHLDITPQDALKIFNA